MGDARVLRFVKLLTKRGFVEEMPVCVSHLEKRLFRFGPLGALLRKNILKQWWKAVILEQPSTYCVESPLLVPHSEASASRGSSVLEGQNMSLRTSLSTDCSAIYLTALDMNGGHLPVSVASSGHCFPEPSENGTSHNSKLLSNGVGETQLLLQQYSPPSCVAQVSDYWLRTRLRWWKHFCSKPSKLSSSGSTQNGQPSEGKESLITYDFPWGKGTVETIRNLGDERLKEMEVKSGVPHQGRYHRKTFHPHVIECQTSLEHCMSVFLTDAFRERELKRKGSSQNQEDLRLALQLHPLLSPYQAAMSTTGSRSVEVRVLADHVAKELREAGFHVLHTPASSGSLDSHFTRNDELGIPFTVVLSDQTLDTGIISIRDRDTRLKQQQHISKLQSHLLQTTQAQNLQ